VAVVPNLIGGIEMILQVESSPKSDPTGQEFSTVGAFSPSKSPIRGTGFEPLRAQMLAAILIFRLFGAFHSFCAFPTTQVSVRNAPLELP
jgi:hypothetical protein